MVWSDLQRTTLAKHWMAFTTFKVYSLSLWCITVHPEWWQKSIVTRRCCRSADSEILYGRGHNALKVWPVQYVCLVYKIILPPCLAHISKVWWHWPAKEETIKSSVTITDWWWQIESNKISKAEKLRGGTGEVIGLIEELQVKTKRVGSTIWHGMDVVVMTMMVMTQDDDEGGAGGRSWSLLSWCWQSS